MAGALVNIQNLGKEFDLENGRRFRIFQELDLVINSGSFVAILGPSGCGKSTLLRIIAGLEHPTDGRISIEGTEVGAPRIGLMLQTYPTLPWLSVRKNVELGLRAVDGHSRDEPESIAVAKYLSRVGLFGWQDAYPAELSGGMLQRVALARTLAMRPDLVLLDEPLGALDALTRKELQILLRDLHKTEGSTFIMVTHDVEEALRVADRILVLGTPGTGILYDSEASKSEMDRDALVDLLATTNITFVAGTWSGYLPFMSRSNATDLTYRIIMGLSDAERITALTEGGAAAAFFTAQALAEHRQDLAALDAVVVHAFSRPTKPEACEHILRRRHSKRSGVIWACPAPGLETALISRIDSVPNRIQFEGTRAACVNAVIEGRADACIVDPKFLTRLVGRWRRRTCLLQPLPEDVWRDLWAVLVAPRSGRAYKSGLLRVSLETLTDHAEFIGSEVISDIHYFTLTESKYLLRSGEIDNIIVRWGGLPIDVDPGALAEQSHIKSESIGVMGHPSPRLSSPRLAHRVNKTASGNT
jgi:ABC-type nitrate/sulfonate/bicarbonate transport system ATPase subunit